MRKVLHVGCGDYHPLRVHPIFRFGDWQEIRFDIDPNVKPDLIGTMTDMSSVEDGGFDAIFSSHNVEHLYPHEVPVALSEFRRVLKPGGFALITLPDIQAVAQLVAADRLEDTAYISPAGPICPIDMMYGLRSSMAAGNLYMAHRTAFTAKTLGQHLLNAGYSEVSVRHGEGYDLWALAVK